MTTRGKAPWLLVANRNACVAKPQLSRRLRGALALCLGMAASLGCDSTGDDAGAQQASPGGGAGSGNGGSSGASASGVAGAALGGAASSGGVAGGVASAGVGGSVSLAGAGGLGGGGTGGAGGGGDGGSAGSGGSAGGGGAGGAATSGGAAGAGGAAGGASGGTAGAGGGTAGAAGAASCPPAAPLTGGTKYCSNSSGTASPGYSYERWAGGEGSGCMTVAGVDAKYSASWTESNDFLARAGLKFDSTKTHNQIGTISAEFAETYTEVPMAGKTSKIYLAVYGWTLEPLTEYYVIEDYGDFVPGPASSDGTPRTSHGTITVDGGTYDIWSLAVKNKPAITGNNKDFNQYFSVRKERRKCGHVSVSEHFVKWTSLGLSLGKLEETMFLMEAQNNSGTVSVTTATFSIK